MLSGLGKSFERLQLFRIIEAFVPNDFVASFGFKLFFKLAPICEIEQIGGRARLTVRSGRVLPPGGVGIGDLADIFLQIFQRAGLKVGLRRVDEVQDALDLLLQFQAYLECLRAEIDVVHELAEFGVSVGK